MKFNNNPINNHDSKIMQITIELRFTETKDIIESIKNYQSSLKVLAQEVTPIANQIMNEQQQVIGMQHGLQLIYKDGNQIQINFADKSCSFVMNSNFTNKDDYIKMVTEIIELINFTGIFRIGVRATLHFDNNEIYKMSNLSVRLGDDILTDETNATTNILHNFQFGDYHFIVQTVNKAHILDFSKNFVLASVLDIDIILQQNNIISDTNIKILEMWKLSKKAASSILK